MNTFFDIFRIQDAGMSVLMDAIKSVRSLRLLDISYCFLTGRQSLPLISSLLSSQIPHLSILICEGNIIPSSERKILIFHAKGNNVGLTFKNRDLISFPIKSDGGGKEKDQEHI